MHGIPSKKTIQGRVLPLTYKDEPTGRADAESQIWMWSLCHLVPYEVFKSTVPYSFVKVIASSLLLPTLFLGNCSSNIQLYMLKLIARGDVTFHKSQPSKEAAGWNKDCFLEQQSTHSKSSKELFETCCCSSSSVLASYHLLQGRQGDITARFQQVPLHKALTWRKCWEVICRKLSVKHYVP